MLPTSLILAFVTLLLSSTLVDTSGLELTMGVTSLSGANSAVASISGSNSAVPSVSGTDSLLKI